MNQVNTFANSEKVQKALGFNNFTFLAANTKFGELWETRLENKTPTSREVVELLDAKDTRVLILNGNNDILV